MTNITAPAEVGQLSLPAINAYCLIQKGTKKPIGTEWQNSPVSLSEALKALKKGTWKRKPVGAIGLMAGPVSGLVFLDHDGHSVTALLKTNGWDCPPTLKISSGRPGHFQLVYRVPDAVIDLCTKRPPIVYTGVTAQEYGKETKEQLDVRWAGIKDDGSFSGVQSLVLGTHPETGNQYNTTEDPIAYAPDWILQLLFDAAHPKQKAAPAPDSPPRGVKWGDREWADSYLSAIDISGLDWYEYRNLLLALHSIGFTEGDALNVSKTSNKHTDKGFSDIWRHIKGAPGFGIAWLGVKAKQHGWVSPFPKTERKRATPATPPQQPPKPAPKPEDIEEIRAEALDIAAPARLELGDILPPDLAAMLTQSAKNKPVSPEAYLLPLLSIVGGRLGVSTSIDVNGCGWHERPILWTAVALPPGSKKSAVLAELTQPLWKWQAMVHEDWERETRDWQALEPDARKAAEKPGRRDILIEDGTIESIVKMVTAKRNNGHLSCIYDELGSLFAGMNQYKGGRGNDHQVLCKLWNGGGINKRVGDDVHFTEKGGATITGMIQPSVLSGLIQSDRDDVTGLWGRFLVSRPVEIAPGWVDGVRVDISAALETLYNRVGQSAGSEFRLSAEAREAAKAIVSITERHWRDGGSRERNLWSKAQGNLFKVALILHCIEHAESGYTPETPKPPQEVGRETLERAWRLVQYSLRNMEVYHSTVWRDDDSKLGPDRIAVIDRLRQNGGTASLAQVKRSLRRQMNNDRLLASVEELTELNILTSEKKGKTVTLSLVAAADSVQPQKTENAPNFGEYAPLPEEYAPLSGEYAPEKSEYAPLFGEYAPEPKNGTAPLQGFQENMHQNGRICTKKLNSKKLEQKPNTDEAGQQPLENGEPKPETTEKPKLKRGDRVEYKGIYYWEVLNVDRGAVTVQNGLNPDVIERVNITEVQPWHYQGNIKPE